MNGYTLSRTGRPTADIICPHGMSIEYINHRDYDLNYDDPAQKTVTQQHLEQWVRDHTEAGDIGEYCLGHRWMKHRQCP